MRRLTSLLFLALIALPAVAQTADETTRAENNRALQQQIEKICQGSIVGFISNKDADPKLKDGNGNLWEPSPSRPSFVAFSRSTEHLVPIFQSTYPGERLIIVLSSSNEINAWAVGSWLPHNHLVCVPVAFVDFITDEDELAFMIGHEIGHTRDPEPLCGSQRAYAQLQRQQKIACESRADEIGYWFLRQAGYSPYAAAGAFGRYEMYLGDTQTGITGWIRQMSIDHPTDPKRIENLRRMLIEEVRGTR